MIEARQRASAPSLTLPERVSMKQPTSQRALSGGASSRGRTLGTIHDDAVAIFFHEPVLEEVLDYSEQDLGRELGGFLLGQIHEYGRQCVEISHFLPAVDARSRAASLTFTHDTWAKMNREIEEKHPDQVVVGWHHTHPGFGIFLSGYDVFIHKNYFSAPWHIALVVDPKRHEFGFFQWRGDEIVDCGFVCITKPKGDD